MRRLATIAIAIIGAVPVFTSSAGASIGPVRVIPTTQPSGDLNFGPLDRGSDSSSAHASIIGGRSASIDEFPWVVFILAEDFGGNQSVCTGSVVAPRIILTAGHCIEDLETFTLNPASGYIVATGAADLTQVKQQNVALVSQAVIYPGFSPSTLRGDAGILILTTPVTAPVLPIASASDSGLLQARTPVAISGWGLTSSRAKRPPLKLQSAATVVQDPGYCKQESARFYPFYSSAAQLCAIDPPNYAASTCHGDSGGPAIARRSDGSLVQIGITSAGAPDCSTSAPNIFTRVDQVSPWVASWIAAIENGGPVPAIKIPKARLPKMSSSRAKYLSHLGLEEDFRYRFRKAIAKRIGCWRIEREKVKCVVSWHQGGNDYYGTITVYFAIYRNTVVWNYRYKIHWVDNYCWFYSGHRQACVIRTRTR